MLISQADSSDPDPLLLFLLSVVSSHHILPHQYLKLLEFIAILSIIMTISDCSFLAHLFHSKSPFIRALVFRKSIASDGFSLFSLFAPRFTVWWGRNPSWRNLASRLKSGSWAVVTCVNWPETPSWWADSPIKWVVPHHSPWYHDPFCRYPSPDDPDLTAAPLTRPLECSACRPVWATNSLYLCTLCLSFVYVDVMLTFCDSSSRFFVPFMLPPCCYGLFSMGHLLELRPAPLRNMNLRRGLWLPTDHHQNVNSQLPLPRLSSTGSASTSCAKE